MTAHVQGVAELVVQDLADRAIAIAVELFNPEYLRETAGGQVLARLGEPVTWKATGHDSDSGFWNVESASGSRDRWPEGEVYDPRVAFRLARLIWNNTLTIFPGETREEALATVEGWEEINARLDAEAWGLC